MRGLLLVLVLLSATAVDSAGQVAVHDRFGRDLSSRTLRLVDWEGYIANPAVEFSIVIPEEWKPATVELAGSNSRLHFAERRLARSEPSTVDDSGPKLTLRIEAGTTPDPVIMAIWPDRDTRDEAHSLWIGVHTASNGLKSMVLPILVDDQDRDRPHDFHVTLETSFDQTAFYTNPRVLEETQRAADDWSYFLSDNNVDEMQRGASRSWVWDENGFQSGYWVTNPVAYKGFLLYAWGMRSLGLFSAGAATGAYQTVGGWPIDIMSAGHIAMDLRGNRNLLGWAFYNDERDWWRNDNHPRGMADFYSIVHHQIGHAMFFSGGHTKWEFMKSTGGSTAVGLLDYLGGPAIIDRFDHIYDGGNEKYVIDPASRRGVFGSEKASGNGVMEPKRWLPTKTDILMAREVGYELRDTTPLHELTVADEVTLSPRGPVYSAWTVSGGVADYLVEVVDGVLPAGLVLDSFTGEVHGIPTSGSSTVTLRATDQLGVVVEQEVLVNVGTTLANEPVAAPPVSARLINYPNPVEHSTIFGFELAQAGAVQLDVFDIQGRRVDQVLSRTVSAGPQEVAWDASALPHGVYIARLTTPDDVRSHRVSIVR